MSRTIPALLRDALPAPLPPVRGRGRESRLPVVNREEAAEESTASGHALPSGGFRLQASALGPLHAPCPPHTPAPDSWSRPAHPGTKAANTACISCSELW